VGADGDAAAAVGQPGPADGATGPAPDGQAAVPGPPGPGLSDAGDARARAGPGSPGPPASGPQTPGEPLLSLVHATKSFGAVRAVVDGSIDLYRGQAHALVGENGITAWGATSDECEANSLEIIATAQRYLDTHGRAEPFGPVIPGCEPLPESQRRARAAELAPVIRGLASTDRRQVGHFTATGVVLDFLARRKHPALAALGTSCPDHFLRTKIAPLVLDLPPSAPVPEVIARLGELHEDYRAGYRAYYQRYADGSSPPMRGADPAIVLVPGVGMFSFGADSQTARVAGEFYVNAINVMAGAEAVSRYRPIPESEKFRIEYWELEEAKLRRRPEPPPLAARVALVTGGGSGIGRATAQRLAAEGACVVIADRDGPAAAAVADGIGSADAAVAATADVTDEASVAAAFAAAALAFGGVDLVVNNAGLSISKPPAQTTAADWDLQHDVMAKGSFLVSREAARVMRGPAGKKAA
jgi:short chain dehydrogenase